MAGNLTDEEKLKRARAFVAAVRRMALKRKLNYFLVTDGASGISNNGNPAVRNAREAQIKWELEHGADPYEDWSKKAGYNPRQATFFSKDVAYDGAPARVVRSPDDGTLQVLGPKGNDPSDAFLCSEQEARDLLFGLKKMKTPREKLHGYGKKYERPWTIDQIRENLGRKIADKLAKDPVHKWRSDTGIELVHKEPTAEELLRIVENWKLMNAAQKRKSNAKSKELFGMTNLQHAKELQKTSAAIDFSKLFPSSKFHTEDELKAKEATFSVGDRVKVVDNIRCRQKGKTGTLVGTPKGMDEKTGAGYKLFYVKFDDEKYGTVGFQSGDIDKV